jgi:hypothetical protein
MIEEYRLEAFDNLLSSKSSLKDLACPVGIDQANVPSWRPFRLSALRKLDLRREALRAMTVEQAASGGTQRVGTVQRGVVVSVVKRYRKIFALRNNEKLAQVVDCYSVAGKGLRCDVEKRKEKRRCWMRLWIRWAEVRKARETLRAGRGLRGARPRESSPCHIGREATT